MKNIIPDKLKKGDEIRVIAPSRSMSLLNDETINIATKRLEDLGFKVTFGKNVYKFTKLYVKKESNIQKMAARQCDTI